MLLGDYDKDVASHIKGLQEAGGIVNRSIVMAAAKSIMYHKNSALLKEHGGPLNLGQSLEESFLCRTGYVKCKATKTVRIFPENYAEANLGNTCSDQSCMVQVSGP